MILAAYVEASNERRVHFRGIAPGQQNSEETSQRAVGDTVSGLIGPVVNSATPAPIAMSVTLR